MNDLQNLDRQIHSMKKQISNFEASSWVEIIKFTKKIDLKKDYLIQSIIEEKLTDAKTKVDDFKKRSD